MMREPTRIARLENENRESAADVPDALRAFIY
jgi:hypothetical protein